MFEVFVLDSIHPQHCLSKPLLIFLFSQPANMVASPLLQLLLAGVSGIWDKVSPGYMKDYLQILDVRVCQLLQYNLESDG